MKKILVLITTYNRPEAFKNLLKSIHSEKNNNIIELIIFNDASEKDYSDAYGVLEDYFPGHYDLYVNEHNAGKANYWKLVDMAYQLLKDKTFDYFIQLPDDVTLVDDFFDKATNLYARIPSKKKACLNILNDYTRDGKRMWTGVKTQNMKKKMHLDIQQVGWVDMCFVAANNLFEILGYHITPVEPEWAADPNKSSGVGMQISQRIVASEHEIYQVHQSLVIHDDHPSVMHPEHREKVKLISNHKMDKITATMATMPGRELSLQETVESIISQVDELHIYMNDINQLPPYLKNDKIKCYLSKDHSGDLGDVGKFYTCEEIQGYHFTIDDDIIYPHDYVKTMIKVIEMHHRKIVVSSHGRIFGNQPISSYYRSATQQFSCLRRVPHDTYAHVIGTGVLAYHTDTLRLHLDMFEYSNMSDIWFSKYCEENNIPRLVIKHDRGWIRLSEKYDENGSIFTNQHKTDSIQTEVVNSITWKFPVLSFN